MPGVTVAVLAVTHIAVFFPGFFAPYQADVQHRLFSFASPTRIHFVGRDQRFHFQPFVCGRMLAPGTLNTYDEDCSITAPIRFFVAGAPYRMFGMVFSRHLFGTNDQVPIFLVGTDVYGRDEFSRLLYGGQISLFAGLLATSIALNLGLLFGGIAGYYGGWVDAIIMRVGETFMTVPWLYLLLSIRAFLPLHMNGQQVFLLLVTMLGAIGWARPARIIRGVVLSAKERDYVLAAKGFGASDIYILRRHVLPAAFGVAATQAIVYLPQFILAEVTLSFFGLGVSEPDPSWGNMLAELQRPFQLENCPWLFSPAILLVVVVLAYHRLVSRYATAKLRV